MRKQVKIPRAEASDWRIRIDPPAGSEDSEMDAHTDLFMVILRVPEKFAKSGAVMHVYGSPRALSSLALHVLANLASADVGQMADAVEKMEREMGLPVLALLRQITAEGLLRRIVP